MCIRDRLNSIHGADGSGIQVRPVPPEATMPTLTIEQAKDCAAAALMRCRTDPENARIVAQALVAAEADGLKGHGLSRVPTYAAQAKVGKVDGLSLIHISEPTRRTPISYAVF